MLKFHFKDIFKYVFMPTLVVCIVFFVVYPMTWLLSRDASGNLVSLIPLQEGDEFAIRFTHSVALTPVEEWFEAHDGQITLRRTVYEDFGAGLPHDAQSGQLMSVENGKISLTGYDLVIPTLYVRVGRIAKHALLYPQLFGDGYSSIYLEKWEAQGKAMAFSIASYSLAEALWRFWSHIDV